MEEKEDLMSFDDLLVRLEEVEKVSLDVKSHSRVAQR
jgi:hypothetical protein